MQKKKSGYTYKPDSVTHDKTYALYHLSKLPTPLQSIKMLKAEQTFPNGYKYTWHFNPQGLFYTHITIRARELLPLIFTLTLS